MNPNWRLLEPGTQPKPKQIPTLENGAAEPKLQTNRPSLSLAWKLVLPGVQVPITRPSPVRALSIQWQRPCICGKDHLPNSSVLSTYQAYLGRYTA